MDESKTRIAMIGAGGMANGVHYPSLASFDDVEITAICDLNIDTAERVANQFNIDQKYTDFDKDDTIRSRYCSGVNTNAFACSTIDYCLVGR